MNTKPVTLYEDAYGFLRVYDELLHRDAFLQREDEIESCKEYCELTEEDKRALRIGMMVETNMHDEYYDVIFDKEEGELIKKERQQLEDMIQFMESTPAKTPQYWSAYMPATPGAYTANDWEECNKPIYKIWDEYLYDLYAMATLHNRLQHYYKRAIEFQENIKDVLQGNTFKERKFEEAY